MLIWTPNFVISDAAGATTFAITDTNLDDLKVTLWNQDDTKLLKNNKEEQISIRNMFCRINIS